MSDKYCILQDDLKDCGVCCLLSIIKFYNGNSSREYLRELTKTTKDGVSGLNLLRAAREFGFEAYGVKGKIKDIKKEHLPIIAHVTIDKKFNHFIVIYEIDVRKNKLLVMDPARGFVSLSFSNFMNISTGYFIILKVKQLIPKLVENDNFLDMLKGILLKYKAVWLIILFLSIIYTVINVLSSYNFKFLFDEAGIISKSDLIIILIVLMVFTIFKLIVNLFRNNLINKINFIVDKKIIGKVYDHIINLPYLYYKNHTNGDLLTRINDLGNIKELISNFFITIFVDLALAIVILVFMIKINLFLTIVTMISLLLYFLISIIFNKLIKGKIKDSYDKSSIVNNHLVESLASFETIKNLSIQKYILNTFQDKYNNYNESKIDIIQKVNVEQFLKNSLLLIANLLVIYLGVDLIKEHNIEISMLFTFISLSNYIIDPIKNILDLSILYNNTKESIRRVKELYSIPKEELICGARDIKVLEGRFDIDNVSYAYNGVDMVLKNISLEINKGDKVLIYGDSGSGKSTLVKLLIKYLDNNYNGNIMIGGFDLKTINTMILRKNICYVSQNEYLYTESIYENITLGRKVSFKRFSNIVKGVYVDDIVKNSNLGYNYLIENNGENISGGEKSRILIARSLIGQFNAYIYDETFSAIDVETENKILKYIFDLYKDKTFIIISHRKSNLDLFNKCIKIGENNE